MNSRPSVARTIGKYLSELLVIILGITLSFLFDEWRQARQDRRAEREILANLRANLQQDTAQIRELLRGNAQMMRATDSLLSIRNLSTADSAPDYVDMACSYVPWMPNTSAISEARQTSKIGLLRDDTLRTMLFTMYDQVYGYAAEWQGIDKHQVLQTLIPAINRAVPVSKSADVAPLYAARGAMLQAPEIRNHLRTGLEYKRSLQGALRMAYGVAAWMHRRTDSLLEAADR